MEVAISLLYMVGEGAGGLCSRPLENYCNDFTCTAIPSAGSFWSVNQNISFHNDTITAILS